MTNSIPKETRFNPSIDNISISYQEPHNILICPILDPPCQNPQGRFYGVVQFLNKFDHGVITNDDIVSALFI